jgi:hypothetical protein
MPAASSHPSRKCNNEGEGNLSSPSSAHASGSKKKRVDSPAASHAPAAKKKAVITRAAAAPAPVVAPAPVLTPVVEPAQKKKAVTPTTAAGLAHVVPPVVESPSKRSKGSGIVTVASRTPVVSVVPSVETAPQKQANVADAVKAPDEDDSEDRSEEESKDAGDEDNSKDKSDESDESEECEDEDDVDHPSDELLEEAEKTKDEGVHHEVAVQGGIAHGNMGQLVVSFYCICMYTIYSYVIHFVSHYIPVSLRKWYSLSTRPQKTLLVFAFLVRQRLVLITRKERCARETLWTLMDPSFLQTQGGVMRMMISIENRVRTIGQLRLNPHQGRHVF